MKQPRNKTEQNHNLSRPSACYPAAQGPQEELGQALHQGVAPGQKLGLSPGEDEDPACLGLFLTVPDRKKQVPGPKATRLLKGKQ